jgi:hypothetical protein
VVSIVNVDEKRAGVRAIERADGMYSASHFPQLSPMG